MTVLALDPFRPLAVDAVTPAPEGASEPDGKLAPVCPVPDEAPPPNFRHPSHGEPTAVWTYRDGSGRTPGHVARFDTPAGKQFLPRCWCRLARRWPRLALARPLRAAPALRPRPARLAPERAR